MVKDKTKHFLGMKEWTEARFEKPISQITISDVESVLPRNENLPDPEPAFEDPKGGRIRYQLKPWPAPSDEAELIYRAQQFEESTPSD
jgi:hypothetical protein